MKKVITGIVCLVFILSLFLLYTNLHVHVVNNLLVTHSHPFDKGHSSKSPLKSHHHNSVEFLIYATLFNFDGIVLLLVIDFSQFSFNFTGLFSKSQSSIFISSTSSSSVVLIFARKIKLQRLVINLT